MRFNLEGQQEPFYTTKIEDFEEVEAPKQQKISKSLASGFINHTLTRIQMTSDYRDSIRLASEGLIKAGTIFGLFIQEDNAIKPVSMWQGNNPLPKPKDEDLENFVYEIGASKDNISSSWNDFKVDIPQYSNYKSVVIKTTSGTATLYDCLL